MSPGTIGFIGLGAMGSGMATRLVGSGFDVTVHNRTRSKSERLGRAGATVADSAADAAKEADLLLLSLATGAAVESTLFGERGAIDTLRPGALVANLSTVSPTFAQELAARLARTGHRCLDCCVLGNAQHAADGELRLMIGGDAEDFAAVREVFAALGKEVSHLGRHGLGATLKLVLNLLMGIEMQALSEALVFGERAGLPRDVVIRMIGSSGFCAPVMRFKLGSMAAREFEPANFRLSLMRKDVMLALAECQRLEVPMPASESAYSMLTAAVQQGLGDLDCAAILAFMERVSGLDGYPWPGASRDGHPKG